SQPSTAPGPPKAEWEAASDAARAEHDLHRPEEDGEVEPGAGVGDVGEVVAQLVGGARVVVAVHLREAGHAGSDHEAFGVARHLVEIATDEARTLGSRAD